MLISFQANSTPVIARTLPDQKRKHFLATTQPRMHKFTHSCTTHKHALATHARTHTHTLTHTHTHTHTFSTHAANTVASSRDKQVEGPSVNQLTSAFFGTYVVCTCWKHACTRFSGNKFLNQTKTTIKLEAPLLHRSRLNRAQHSWGPFCGGILRRRAARTRTHLIRSRKASMVETFLSSAPEPMFSLMEGSPGWMLSTHPIPMMAAQMVVVK